jgi:hypothetical protein
MKTIKILDDGDGAWEIELWNEDTKNGFVLFAVPDKNSAKAVAKVLEPFAGLMFV